MTDSALYGAIEAGGTKIICLIGQGPDDIRAQIELPTRRPDETIPDILAFFEGYRSQLGPLARVGLASFGPVDINLHSPQWGHVLKTPKPGWTGTDLAGAIKAGLGVPVVFDTDVNGAALAEGRWGAAQGLSDYAYITVGTGIGGGIVSGGALVHGVMHGELGHIPVPHDLMSDPYEGHCPFHGDCLEGMACGPAIEARWGTPAQTLSADHPAWAMEAGYLSVLTTNLILMQSTRRILLGGGVMKRASLFEALRAQTKARLNGYLTNPPHDGDLVDVIMPPGLGERAGPLGALALALDADRAV
ncbi:MULTISPECIES: ROK family protein [unclassified Iodidimonas]|jgi:fructokinase|uniref:ROK family protein n=1 Tax=unclassified Iodidimonas TaxID=2626145 RepID=UPI002483136D|nr:MULTISPECIES: ROK family protein [unclassified Iodidimonas]